MTQNATSLDLLDLGFTFPELLGALPLCFINSSEPKSIAVFYQNINNQVNYLSKIFYWLFRLKQSMMNKLRPKNSQKVLLIM